SPILVLAAPSPWGLSITILPSSFEPASPLNPPGTEGRWLFSICRARSWLGPSLAAVWISAHGASGSKGAKNHLSLAHGIFVSAVFSLGCGRAVLHPYPRGAAGRGGLGGPGPPPIAAPAGRRWEIFGAAEERAATNGVEGVPGSWRWAGGGEMVGEPPTSFRFLRTGEPRPLLVAAAGGSRASLKRQDRGGLRPPTGGRASSPRGQQPRVSRQVQGAAERRGPPTVPAGGSARKGWGQPGNAEVGAKLGWVAAGGFAGGGGTFRCTLEEGSGAALRFLAGSDASETDIPWTDEERVVFVIHPNSEFCLQLLAVLLLIVMESHGEVEIRLNLNCCLCLLKICQCQAELQLANCMCPEGMELTADNVTCMERSFSLANLPTPSGPLILMVAVVVVLTLSLPTVCGSWMLPPGLMEVSSANFILLTLAHGVFGEDYEGLVIGLPGDPSLLQVTIKTLPELCCPQDGLDFLTKALIMGSAIRTSEYCECIRATSGLILLELVSGGDMKGFLSQVKTSGWDIAEGCHHLEENHFIHRNCLLSGTGFSQVAKIGDFCMQAISTGPVITTRGPRLCGGRGPEASLEGIFTSKTDSCILEHLQYSTQVEPLLRYLPIKEHCCAEFTPFNGINPSWGRKALGSLSLGGLRSPQAQELSLGRLKNLGGSLLGPQLPFDLKSPESRSNQAWNLWNLTSGS
ncbi:hypothetical protein FD754_022253, partial [Muntiacus muntjak]